MIFSISFILFGIALVAWQLWSDSRVQSILGKFTGILLVFATLGSIYQAVISGMNWGDLSTSLIVLSISAFVARFIGKSLKTKMIYLFSSSVLQILFIGAFMLDLNPSSRSITENSIPEFLIKIDPEYSAEFESFVTSQKEFKITNTFKPADYQRTELDDYYVVDFLGPNPKKIKKILTNLPYVEYIEFNDEVFTPAFQSPATQITSASYIFKDPLNSKQWSLENTGMSTFYELAKKQKAKKTIKLFILDTGVDGAHEDLKDVFKANGGKHDKDKRGHGTHCAGIAAAVTGNNLGISSFNFDKRIEIHSEKVLADFGGGTQAGIIQGMINAVDKGADVISMSLGGISNDKRQKAYNEAVRYALDRNCIVVVAAGNSSSKAINYSPANSEGVITVAATDPINNLATFSNTLEGIKMGVYAPGVDILSTYPNNKYETFSGTSMAAPFVAGLVSLLKSIEPSITAEQVHNILNSSTQQANGVPIVDPKDALEKLIGK